MSAQIADQSEIMPGNAIDNHKKTQAIICTTTHQHSAMDTPAGDLDILSTLVKSGRITRKEYVIYKRLHDQRISPKGNNFNFEARPRDAVSDAFNTAELLEMILLNLRPGHCLTQAQLVCRGFKQSMDRSPTFQRRIAVAMQGLNLARRLAWNVKPKCMSFHYETSSRVIFKLVFTTELSFERHRAIESFRKLAVSDTTPQRIEILWHDRDILSALCNEMIWLSAEQGEKLTFGQIFDAVAAKVPAGRKVGMLSLFLFKSRASSGRTIFGWELPP